MASVNALRTTTQKAMRERKEAMDADEVLAAASKPEGGKGKGQSLAIAAYLQEDGGQSGPHVRVGRSFRVQSADDVREAQCKHPPSLIKTQEARTLQRSLSLILHTRPQTLTTVATVTVRQVRKVVQGEQNRNRGIIDPRTSAFIQNWDLAMLLLLLFTALITPYEVVFLPASNSISPLFVVNRLVDAAFGVDMYIQFHLGFQAGPRQGNKVVMDRRAIRNRYLSFWFWIDALSVMPLWIIGFVVSEPEDDELSSTGAGALADNETLLDVVGADSSGKSATQMLQIMRMIRLLRLIKVTRILKASKIFRRLEMNMEVSYGVLGMVKLLTVLFSWGHIQACLWGLLPQISGDPVTWVVALRRAHADCEVYPDTCEESLTPWDIYIAAFYWSIMTLTSVGYGEMLPLTTPERAFCSALMLISAMMWTYVMGQACAIAATLDPSAGQFHMIMDNLNRYMRERGLSHSLKVALRTYFHNSRQMSHEQRCGDVVGLMSPLMASTVALAVNRTWLERVWWLRSSYHSGDANDMHAAFVAAISMKLTMHAYVSQERVPTGILCILRRGLVCRRWAIISKGKVWGDDLILDRPELIDFSEGVTLTYVEVYALARAELELCCRQFPPCALLIRKAARRMTIQRLLLRSMRDKAGLQVKSIAPKKASVAAMPLTLDQKVDVLIDTNEHARRERQRMEANGVEQSATPPPPEAETADGTVATELCAPASAHSTLVPGMAMSTAAGATTPARSTFQSTQLRLDAARRTPSEAKSLGESHAALADQVKQLLERHREVAAQQVAMGEELERMHVAMMAAANEEGLMERFDNAPAGIDFRETARKLVGWATPPKAERHLSA